MKTLLLWVTVWVVVGSAAVYGQTMPWDLQDLKAAPEVQWLDDSSPVRSLLFANEPFNGQPTQVFAFYATPGTIAGDASLDKDLPAVVLIHGGGGTAFAEWVWLWAKRGYAAIAVDLSGRRPSAPEFDADTGELIVVRNHRNIIRERLANGGPEQGGQQKFADAGGDLTDDWQLHAVAACIRAHSLVRSFKEVDADRTAVTGISWGGYLTCIVASLDDRFKAAVPVYGCGFLYEGESVQKPSIDRLSPEHRAEWIRLYEPSTWLPQCRVPILFVNGTNDVHYPLDSYARTYALVPANRHVRIQVQMPHSHPAGWAPAEIGLFIDQHLKGSDPLPVFAVPAMQQQTVSAGFSSSRPLQKAELHYTTDSGRLADRSWHTVPATIVDQTITATVPQDALIWLLSATDDRGAMTSTEVLFRD